MHTETNAPKGKPIAKTGRPAGDHGTAAQAVKWLLYVNPDHDSANAVEFLRAWDQGDAAAEWPEFYDWLNRQTVQ
jgi:hypothetical protein